MPGNEPSGSAMQQFVNRKYLDDLKMRVPKASTVANSRQTRKTTQHAVRPQENILVLHQQQQHQGNLNGQRQFFNTDASSIGTVSTAAKAKRIKIEDGILPQDQPNNDRDHDGGFGNVEGSENEFGEGESDNDLSPNPLEARNQCGPKPQLDEAQKLLMASLERGGWKGSSLPHMEGDSYPDTTSGRISPVECTNNETHSGSLYRAAHDTPQIQQRQVSSSRLIPMNASAAESEFPAHQPALQEHRDRGKVKEGFITRPHTENTDPLDQVNANFIFSKPTKLNKQAASTLSTTSHQQTTIRPVTSNSNLLSAPAQRTSIPVTGETLSREEQQLEELDGRLDYERSELFQMDYCELKVQSFDFDPNAKQFKLSVERKGDSLDTKLSDFKQVQHQEQAAFFASLPMGQWEGAGDWFLARFGEALRKLKEARQEKRKLAKTFEDEIEKRHEAISKKRKQTDDELMTMKESGVKVLQGTPKKTKTK